jgi:hypothetical protein
MMTNKKLQSITALFLIVQSLFNFSSIYAGLMGEAENLKTPSQVIHEIKEFKKTLNSKISGPYVYFPTKDDDLEAERLLHSALWVYYLCDLAQKKYGEAYVNELESWMHEYQSWSRDPMRFQLYKAAHPNLSHKEAVENYSSALRNEREIMLDDCNDCKSHQRGLKQQIRDLECFITYNKTREGREEN